jgi:alkanesulfonate monooxygenase SsuD/methylene tetrahydromethanopterin reductase-like flavin-dependent oxidoreductase (luciferase family)
VGRPDTFTVLAALAAVTDPSAPRHVRPDRRRGVPAARARPRLRWLRQVSADVVVGETDAAARELAAGYGPWVHSIRTGAGAIPFPDAAGAAAYPWSAEAAALVEDRVATQLTGSPATVVEKLAAPARVTGADELLVTTITHDHAARVSSQRLLAREWSGARPSV